MTECSFDSVSKEENITESHTIVPDGYDIGRDLLVAAAVNSGGTTSFNGVTYKASSQNVTGLLEPGSNGVNHGKPPRIISLSHAELANDRYRCGWSCRSSHNSDRFLVRREIYLIAII